MIFVNLIVKPFWIFGIDRTVQNTVGGVDYGAYFQVFNFAFLFHILLDMGLANYNSRAIAQDESKLPSYLSSIFTTKLALSFVYALLCAIGAYLSNFTPMQWQMLGYVCGAQVLLSFLLYFRSNLQGLHLFRTDSWMSVLDRLFMIFICGSLLYSAFYAGTEFQILHFAAAQNFAYLISALIAGGIVWRYALKKGFRYSFDTQLIKRILRESLPFAIATLLMSIYNRTDGYMIALLIEGDPGKAQVGTYASAFRLLDAANMFAILFATILLPMFSRQIKARQFADVRQLTILSARIMFVGAVALSASCYVYRHEIIHLLYTEANTQYVQTFGLLIWSFIAISSVYVTGTLLTAAGRLKSFNQIALLGVSLNILLNYLLIPQQGALGAALATLATQLLMAIGAALLVFRYLQFRRFLPQSLIFIGFFIGSLLIAHVSQYLFANYWLIGFISSGLAALALAFICKLIDHRAIQTLLKP